MEPQPKLIILMSIQNTDENSVFSGIFLL